MSTEKKLVYRLDESLAPGGEPKELHLILWDGVFGGSPGTPSQVRSGCSQGVSFVEFTIDRSLWNRKVYGDAGHSRKPSDSPVTGGTKAQSIDRQVDQGSDSPRSNSMSEVDNPGERVGESLLEREIQRGDDPVLYRSTRLSSCSRTYQIGWEHGYTTAGMLRDGRLDEAVAAGYVTEQCGRRWVSPPFSYSEGGLQVSANSGPSSSHDRPSTERTRDSEGEGVL